MKNRPHPHDLYDFDELDQIPHIKNVSQAELRPSRHLRPPHKSRPSRAAIQAQVAEQDDSRSSLDFTYQASRHERAWLLESLGYLYEQQWFSDVLRLLKGGKEASVYLCAANPLVEAEYLAAKVYRPRRFRNLKNDHLYREGRPNLDSDGNVILDGGMQHAMDRRTDYGLLLLHTSWIEHEFQAMKILHAAGADIPVPYVRGNNAILMRYIGAAELPAPTLNTVNLPARQAHRLFRRVLHNIEVMLAHDLVHGDLSAYNILYWGGEITLIDFPQVIQPEVNRNAFRIFERDVTRVCEYFAGQGVRSDPRKIAAGLWASYNHRQSPEVHPALLE